MPYKSGTWGEQAKERSKGRLEYFKKSQLARLGHPRTYIGIGHIGEQEALIILRGSKKLLRKEVDLEWNGKKIDVKTSSFHNKPFWSGWTFWLKKQRGLCDFYLLICKDMNKNNSYLFLIPEKDISKDSLTISQTKINLFQKYQLKVR